MSGIAGIYCLNGEKADLDVLGKMLGTIAHRGAGEKLLALSRNLALGQRLPSTTSLKSPPQPAVRDNGSPSIVYDGHIYNSPELRRELEEKGYIFTSNNDIELILAGYREWGVRCLEKLNGIWAFALWDGQQQELFCARDRFGEKPFYYYSDAGLFIFASEIKALLAYPGLPVDVDEEAVYNYLMWGVYQYSSDTFFKGISELPPSHYMRISGMEEFTARRWWQINVNYSRDTLTEDKVDEHVGQFRTLLEDSIRIRLRHHTCIGATLSGGLESSSITLIASNLLRGSNAGQHLNTFSTYYADNSVDEVRFMKSVLREIGSVGTYVSPDGNELLQELPALIWHLDQPADLGSTYARWIIARRAREEGIEVLLSGDGGDGLMANHLDYAVYFIELALNRELRRLIAESGQASAIVGGKALVNYVGMVVRGALYARSPKFLQSILRDSLLGLRGWNTHRFLAPLFDRRYQRYGIDRFSDAYGEVITDLQRSLHRHVTGAIHPVTYMDRISSAHSFESAMPFLDHRLVEFLFSLPSGLKIRRGWTRWIQREAMKGFLPEEVRLRKDKIGFATPTRTWLIQNRERIKTLFGGKNVLIGQFVDLVSINNNLDSLLARNRSAQEVWQFVNLELWLRTFF